MIYDFALNAQDDHYSTSN